MNDQSRNQPAFVLPEKFSPSKTGLNDSRFKISSVEKLNLEKVGGAPQPLNSPRKS